MTLLVIAQSVMVGWSIEAIARDQAFVLLHFPRLGFVWTFFRELEDFVPLFEYTSSMTTIAHTAQL